MAGDRPRPTELLPTPRESIDAAVLDINLQGEAVFPVADALIERGIPFVFATGYDQSAVPAPYERVRRWESRSNRRSSSRPCPGSYARLEVYGIVLPQCPQSRARMPKDGLRACGFALKGPPWAHCRRQPANGNDRSEAGAKCAATPGLGRQRKARVSLS